jgi:hypothetical protein
MFGAYLAPLALRSPKEKLVLKNLQNKPEFSAS